MGSKTEKDRTKQLQDKCQSVLNALLRDEDNKYCVDCDSKGPRWASWNIGVFLCIRCAGIHRNLGVHISKVKSVNLDTWTPEQVVSLQQMGNSRARAVYEANLPDNFRRPQNDISLESFIRAKYEHKKYIAREWVAPTLPKVNWEKEIDDEIEKQRRKKKTIIEKKPVSNVEVPQLPKPKNSSPRAGRAATVATVDKKDDLLGLQNGEDNFSGFLSAAPSSIDDQKRHDEMQSIKSEEESFFNQTAPSEKEKMKMTKDSILALYGNTPTTTTTFSQFPTQQPQYHQQNFQFGGFPQQQHQPLSQSFNGFAPQWVAQNVGQFTAQGQMQPVVNQFPVPTNQFQNHHQYPIGHFSGGGGGGGGVPLQQPNFAAPANPFYGGANQNLPQQFGNLNLNNAPGTNSTIATNIWQ